jgi:hypothetical protein
VDYEWAGRDAKWYLHKVSCARQIEESLGLIGESKQLLSAGFSYWPSSCRFMAVILLRLPMRVPLRCSARRPGTPAYLADIPTHKHRIADELAGCQRSKEPLAFGRQMQMP